MAKRALVVEPMPARHAAARAATGNNVSVVGRRMPAAGRLVAALFALLAWLTNVQDGV